MTKLTKEQRRDLSKDTSYLGLIRKFKRKSEVRKEIIEKQGDELRVLRELNEDVINDPLVQRYRRIKHKVLYYYYKYIS